MGGLKDDLDEGERWISPRIERVRHEMRQSAYFGGRESRPEHSQNLEDPPTKESDLAVVQRSSGVSVVSARSSEIGEKCEIPRETGREGSR